MNKEKFLEALSRELRRLPREEYEKAMDYYIEFFEDAGPESEQAVIGELGDPKDVAAQIIMDAALERMNEPHKSVKRGLSTVWIVILGVCAAPIALPVAIAILLALGGVLLGVGGVLIGILVAVGGALAAGVVAVVCGIILLFTNPASAFANIGLGLAETGLSVLGGMLLCMFFKWLMKGIWKVFRNIMNRRKKA